VTAHLLRRGAAGAVAMTLLLATPALAHPFFDPDEVPADSLAQVTLDLAHGCDVDDHGDGDGFGDGAEAPTREVAIEVPEEATFVDPRVPEGWDLQVEGGDGDQEVIVYTAEDGTDEPAPRFDLEVALAGGPGDEVYWRVVQACDDATYRWVGTPDEPAEDPAVGLELTAADEDAPPPEQVGQTDGVTVVDQEDEPMSTDPVDEAPEDEAPADLTDDFEAADDQGMPGWILIVVLLATLVVAGIVLSLKSRDDEPDGANGAGTGTGGAGEP
jgi:uncharacterized protein YcnI